MTEHMSADKPVPVPFGPAIESAVRRALEAVPAERRGVLSLGVTKQGGEVSLGLRRKNLTIGAYGVGYWKGGWEAGAKGTIVF